MESYSEKLQRILAASGWSQEALSERLDVSFVTLNKWVNQRSEPRESARQRIDLIAADILGADEVSREAVSHAKKQAVTKKLSVHKLLDNRDILDEITVGLTYHSNATEGSTMTESDVTAVLFDHKVLANRTAIEQREAINHRTALHFLLDELSRNPRLELTPELVRATHLRLMSGIIADAGTYRSHGARISGARVPLANFIKIPELVAHWCRVVNEESADPVALLATSHARFEQIHPFSDGNGRTGRLLLFILALKFGLVPPIIHRERRSAYYKYLELYQTRELSDPLEKFIAEAIVEASGLLDDLV